MSPGRLKTSTAKRARLLVAVQKLMLCQMHSSVPNDSAVAQHRFPLAGMSVYLKNISTAAKMALRNSECIDE
jgi:hypothetical protein